MKVPEQLWQAAARLQAARVGFAWVTVVRTTGSTPRHVGAKMIVLEADIVGTVGGGRWEHKVIEAARAALAAGRARAVRFHLTHELGMCCGGEMEVFIDVVAAPPPLVIFGAGHVAAALAPLARSIGFAVWVVDELEEFASETRFPGAKLVHGFDVPSWTAALPLGPRASVLIATRDHAEDQRLLEALIDRELGWLGVIGSRGKAGRFRRRLEAKAVAPERIAWVRMPVGLDIGAETPEEIAVSIAAELIQVRHAGQPRSGDRPPRSRSRPRSEHEHEHEHEHQHVTDGLAIILAAGRGERMGGVAKALLDAGGGHTFLSAIVATIRPTGLRPIVVTGGPFATEVAAAAAALAAATTHNADADRGMASSIATGLTAATSSDIGALIWPVDHPLVRADTVVAILHHASAESIVVPTLEDRGGHPVWFGRSHFAALLDPGLGARGGARALLAENPRVIRVNCGDPGVRYDIDTPPDYAKMRLP